MSLVGNETLIVSPPVKKGFTRCRSRRHHLHPPGLLGQRRNGDQIAGLDELDRLVAELPDQRGLAAGSNELLLDVLERLFPVVAIAEVARGGDHPLLAPGQLPIGDRQQPLGVVGNHLRGQLALQSGAADRAAQDGRLVVFVDAGDLLPQELGIVLQAGVEFLVRRLDPPAHDRIVAVIELVPMAKGPRRGPDGRGGAPAIRPLGPRTVGDCPLLWSPRNKRGLSPFLRTVLGWLQPAAFRDRTSLWRRALPVPPSRSAADWPSTNS